MLSVIFQTSLDRYSGTEKVSSERSGHETTESLGSFGGLLLPCGIQDEQSASS
jgi:hypothetical protein